MAAAILLKSKCLITFKIKIIIRKMGTFSYSETEKMLSKHGIKLPLSKLTKSKEEAISFAKKVGFPLALKVNSDNILHKTDVNGVKLDIKKMYELEDAYEEMSKRFNKQEINGFLLQKMHQGHSIIIGMKRDKQFGPVIVFGLGGIFVEIIKDVSYRIAPITFKDAEEMIREIKMFPILAGARGNVKANLRLLSEVLVKISSLALKEKDILEIDLNPVIVNDKEAVAVDARLVR